MYIFLKHSDRSIERQNVLVKKLSEFQHKILFPNFMSHKYSFDTHV